MDLKGIISISGKSGLSKIVSQSRGGLIVESLEDGKRFAVHGSERVSSLEDISIYTYEEDLLLTEVFEAMFKKAEGKQILSHKSSAEELRAYLKEVLPNYDEERVYTSDIKKLVQWFNILIDKKLLSITKEKKVADKEKKTETKEVKKTTAKTKKPAPSKNAGNAKPKAAPVKKTATKASSKGK
tara:strand:+ start:749 stop:1300 length:552 start_codon:yes stop_codon:yes gene_type:complete